MCHDGIPELDYHGEIFEVFDGFRCHVCVLAALVVDDHLVIIVSFYPENIVLAQQAYAMVGSFRMRRITDVTQVVDHFAAVFPEKGQGAGEGLNSAVTVGHDADYLVGICFYGGHFHFVRHYITNQL